MRKLLEYVYQHGATHWVRVRIPKDLKLAYPEAKDEPLENLNTGDPAEAKALSYAAIVRIKAEFQDKRLQRELSHASLSPKRIGKMTDAELTLVGGFNQRSVLQQDEARRQAGLDYEEFDALGRELASQRADLAQRKSQPILGVLQTVLHLCGLNFRPKPEAGRITGSELGCGPGTLVPARCFTAPCDQKLDEGDTEGYGDRQLPYEHPVEFFREIKFPAIPALPWQRGQGTERHPKRATKLGATPP